MLKHKQIDEGGEAIENGRVSLAWTLVSHCLTPAGATRVRQCTAHRMKLSLERIMALHLRTTLGDALWRSEAGLPLLLPCPGGGTPGDYVEELAARFALLGIEE